MNNFLVKGNVVRSNGGMEASGVIVSVEYKLKVFPKLTSDYADDVMHLCASIFL
jgi:hypothetical protein